MSKLEELMRKRDCVADKLKEYNEQIKEEELRQKRIEDKERTRAYEVISEVLLGSHKEGNWKSFDIETFASWILSVKDTEEFQLCFSDSNSTTREAAKRYRAFAKRQKEKQQEEVSQADSIEATSNSNDHMNEGEWHELHRYPGRKALSSSKLCQSAWRLYRQLCGNGLSYLFTCRARGKYL